MQGVIYRLTNKVNGMMYIGQTMDLKKRITRHLYASKSIEHANGKYPISLAIAEFGIDSFVCDILWKSDESDDASLIRKCLNEKERYFIKKYDSVNKGYNQTWGGEGMLGYHLPQESIEKIRKGNLGKKLPKWVREANIKRFSEMRNEPGYREKLSKRVSGRNNPMYGVHLKGEDSYMFGRHLSDETKRKIALSKIGKKGTPMSEEHKEKLRKLFTGVPKSEEHKEKLRNASLGQKHPERRKPVLQYDKNGNFIKEWDCAFDAEKIYNDRHINDCCRGTRRIAANYQWRFKEDKNFPRKIAGYSRSGNKKIAMTDKDGNTLKMYGSIKDAVVELGINRSSLQEVLSGRQKSTKGMYFTYC